MRIVPKALLTATLAHGFGGTSPRPVAAGLWRLSWFTIGAVGLSFLIVQELKEVPTVTIPHAELLAVTVAFITQTIVTLALLTASGASKAGQRETFARLLLVWPLKPVQRWLIFMLPSLILGVLALLMLAWPVIDIATRFGVAWPLVSAAMLLGYASAFGLVRSPVSEAPKLVLFWIPGVLWLEFEIIKRINDFSVRLEDRYFLMAGAITVLLLLILQAYRAQDSLRSYLAQHTTHHAVRLKWPHRLWLLAKLSRRPSFVTSLSVSLLISAAVAIVAHHYHFKNPDGLALLTAILAASVGTDIRATARRQIPAEITALRATGRFMASSALYAISIGLVIALPCALVVISESQNLPVVDSAHWVLQPLIGALAGLFSGVLIVPQGRDISGQFIAMISALAILFALPQLPAIANLPTFGRVLFEMMLCLILATATFGIEFKRNPYYWRPYHA